MLLSMDFTTERKLEFALHLQTQYSSSVRSEIDIGAYDGKADLIEAIRRIEYATGNTHTGTALDYIRNIGFSTQHGARRGVPKVSESAFKWHSALMVKSMQWFKHCFYFAFFKRLDFCFSYGYNVIHDTVQILKSRVRVSNCTFFQTNKLASKVSALERIKRGLAASFQFYCVVL